MLFAAAVADRAAAVAVAGLAVQIAQVDGVGQAAGDRCGQRLSTELADLLGSRGLGSAGLQGAEGGHLRRRDVADLHVPGLFDQLRIGGAQIGFDKISHHAHGGQFLRFH